MLYLFLDLIKVGELGPSPLARILPHSANINRKGLHSLITMKAGSPRQALISWWRWQNAASPAHVQRARGLKRWGRCWNVGKCIPTVTNNSIMSPATRTGLEGFILELSKLSNRKLVSAAETWLNKFHCARKNQVTFESAVGGELSGRKLENNSVSQIGSAISKQGPRGAGTARDSGRGWPEHILGNWLRMF